MILKQGFNGLLTIVMVAISPLPTQLKEDKKLNIQAIPILKTTKHSNYKLFPTTLLLLNYQIKILNETSLVGHN